MNKYFKGLIGIIVSVMFLFGNILEVNAASASISVSSSASKIVLGKTFTVTVKISSGSLLGSWEWTINYDKKLFKLTSGESNVADVGDGRIKSKSYTYKFKAIGKGSGKIGVKSAGAIGWDENKLSLSTGSRSVTVITQADLEASYSKNNNLKSLSIDGYTLSPAFNKNTTDYTVEVGANTETVKINASKEDSSASINGSGNINVAEGDNKISVVVTAENGSTKTYNILVTVIDNNPIEVTIDNEKYTVVKRASSLEKPENFEEKEIVINEIKIPAFYSELNKYYLVGLKDKDSNISLFIYNETDNSYTLYSETKLNQLILQPLKMDKNFTDYTNSSVIINESTFDAYQMNNKKYYIIHARELTTGKDDYYLYDSDNTTVIKYNDDEIVKYKQKAEKYYNIILLLCGETILVFIILLIILINNLIKKSKKRKLLNNKEEKNKKTEVKEKEKTKEEIPQKEEIKEDNNNNEDSSKTKKVSKKKKN